MADFITMADKIIASMSYIITVSKKKATIEKILAHLSKSEICDKTWLTESLKVLLSDMTAKNQIELVDSENQPLCYPPICQLLLDDQLNRYIMATPNVLFLPKTCF